MSKHRKTWSIAEKQEVIAYYKIHGSSKTSRHFNVSAVSIGKWQKQYEMYGINGLTGKSSSNSETDFELDWLKRENKALKAIVAEKELQIRIQAEMIKKSH